MKCFACDVLLEPDKGYDSQTDRFYCSACFQLTTETQMELMKEEDARNGRSPEVEYEIEKYPTIHERTVISFDELLKLEEKEREEEVENG